jgi:hypothetical protein
MTTLTAKKVYDLNNMNAAAQRAQLGTLLMGGAVVPATGTVSTVNTLKYTTTPAIGTATYVHAAIALTSGAQTGYATGTFTQPDFARIATVKGNASGITGNVVVHGTNIAGTVISDTIALSGASEVLGVLAFKTITSVDLPAETHSGTDTVSIGAGNKVGYPSIIDNVKNVISVDFDGAADTGATTAATTLEGSIQAVTGTFNGTKVFELTYVVVG